MPLGTVLFDRLLAAANEDITSALLNLTMDASVLIGTASLLCYKDFVAVDQSDAAHMYSFFCAMCGPCTHHYAAGSPPTSAAYRTRT
eukprot:5318369-Prymnesium_polylepis.1